MVRIGPVREGSGVMYPALVQGDRNAAAIVVWATEQADKIAEERGLPKPSNNVGAPTPVAAQKTGKQPGQSPSVPKVTPLMSCWCG